jgi:O-antigen/teichoic acid export membrane protein
LSHIEIAQRSTRGSFALFLGNFLTTLISAVGVIVIARLLGPEGYGIYTLAILFPSIVQGFVGFGVYTGVTRYAAFYNARGEADVAKRMTINGILFLLAFGFVLSIGTYFGAETSSNLVFHRPELVALTQIASALVFAQAVMQAAVSALLGWGSMPSVSATNVTQSILRLLTATALVLAGLGALGAVVGHLASIFVAGSVGILLLFRSMTSKSTNSIAFFLSDIGIMIRYSFPFFVGAVGIALSNQYVYILLASIGTNASVGWFQSAVNVTSAITVTASAITQALFPAFAHLDGANADTGLAFRYSVKYMGLVTSPTIFFLAGAASPLTLFLYGSTFSPTAFYLVILSFSNLPTVLGHVLLSQYFNGIGKTRFSLVFSLANALSLTILAPLLAFSFGLGIPGLVYAMLISNTIAIALGLWMARSMLGARIDGMAAAATLGASAIALAPTVIINSLISSPIILLLVDVFVFSIVYLVMLPAFGAMSKDDVLRLRISVEGMGLFGSLVGVVLVFESGVLKLRAKVTKSNS